MLAALAVVLLSAAALSDYYDMTFGAFRLRR
jgi:hypothetical protein